MPIELSMSESEGDESSRCGRVIPYARWLPRNAGVSARRSANSKTALESWQLSTPALRRGHGTGSSRGW
jgi:hypothetical protein